MASPTFTFNPSDPDTFNSFVYTYSIISTAGTVFQIYQYYKYPAAAESISLIAWGLYWTSYLFWFLYAAEPGDMQWGLWISCLVGMCLNFIVFAIGVDARFIHKPVLGKALEMYKKREDQLKQAGDMVIRKLINESNDSTDTNRSLY